MTGFLQAIFTGFTEDEIALETEALLDKAAAVKANGWSLEVLSWRRHEFVAVALVLGDDAAIAQRGLTTEEAVSQMAHLLYGGVGGHDDKANGFQRTRGYFASVADKLAENPPHG